MKVQEDHTTRKAGRAHRPCLNHNISAEEDYGSGGGGDDEDDDSGGSSGKSEESAASHICKSACEGC